MCEENEAEDQIATTIRRKCSIAASDGGNSTHNRRDGIYEWIVAELSKDTASMETQTMAEGPTVAERRLERKMLHLERKLECAVGTANEAAAANTTLARWQGVVRMINDIEMPADDG